MFCVTLQSVLLCAVAFLGVATAAPQYHTNPPPATGPACGASAVSVRLPPAFDNGASSAFWSGFEPSWYFKPWNMVFASNPANLALRNFQYDPTPVDAANPNGTVNDLGSFQVPNNTKVFTTYGVDTPQPTYPSEYLYAGTGIIEGASSLYSVLAWGCDENRLPYYVNYATATELTKTPAGIDIMSTQVTGMDQKTLHVILNKLRELGNDEITAMANAMSPMTNDDGRNGMPRINTCDDACKSNKGLLEVLPPS